MPIHGPTQTQGRLIPSRLLMALLHFATFAALQWAYVNGIALIFGAEGYAIFLCAIGFVIGIKPIQLGRAVLMPILVSIACALIAYGIL